MDVDSDDGLVDSGRRIRSEWIGTSQFFTAQSHLDALINYRKAIVHDLSLTPYDPTLYLDLSRLDSRLGFTDMGVAYAYKAFLPIQAALRVQGLTVHPSELSRKVRTTLTSGLQTRRPIVIDDELQDLHLKAYRELLNGLLGCAAFWDGLVEAKKALKLFPGDDDLLITRDYLKDGFQDRHNGLKELGSEMKDIVEMTRTGKIYQKLYPWMDDELYVRKPTLVVDINQNLGNRNCEIRAVRYDKKSPKERTGIERRSKGREKESKDVGPLGVFATCHIAEGETIMVDECVTGISDIPSSKLKHCDACHASLAVPFLHSSQVVRPKRCKDVAFCCQECHDIATTGYHTVLCGKDCSLLYQHEGLRGGKRAGTRWRPIMFLRVVAVVLANFRHRRKGETIEQQALQHPLVARMAANYSPPHKMQPDMPHDWQYFDNVVAPARILSLLGVNIFTDPRFTPEVIQTIYWRIENNVSMTTTDLSINYTTLCNSTSTFKPLNDSQPPVSRSEGKARVVSLNPNFLFFNHSCEPNVDWHGSVPNPWVSLNWLEGMDGELLKPGCTTVVCRAARDINPGEELKISYIGDPIGKNEETEGGREGRKIWLQKWFDGGCGCSICVRENEVERQNEKNERGTEWGVSG